MTSLVCPGRREISSSGSRASAYFGSQKAFSQLYLLSGPPFDDQSVSELASGSFSHRAMGIRTSVLTRVKNKHETMLESTSKDCFFDRLFDKIRISCPNSLQSCLNFNNFFLVYSKFLQSFSQF
uniref:Uncharacterized protein n=1 Tax=Cacopsylla melanoneura TaxID=428564 RepID=A0A8D8TI94_9HEMI